MKAFIMAADALTPEYIFQKRELFPHMCEMLQRGAGGAYSAYVQKGYAGSYTSEQNWASIYTGLTPKEHGIALCKYKDGGVMYPQMQEFNNLQPFWQVLNNAGLTIGMWSADCCDEPVEINGYVVSSKYTPIFTPQENREAPREIQACGKDREILSCIEGTPPPRLYPKTLKQLGLCFEDIKANPSLADKVANEKNFEPMLDNFKAELDFWFTAMGKAQEAHPVDIMYLFTPTTDILAHFSLYSDNNPVLIKAYQMLDKYIGEFVSKFQPEVTIVLSDHGQQNYKELVACADAEIQREAFSARDIAVWMNNGSIAFEAKNGGLLFTTHSLLGSFIACGKGIKHTNIADMRTVDIYPTLLELFGAVVPGGRGGYVMDIFNRPVVNGHKLLQSSQIEYLPIALIQNHQVSVTDIILNELYNDRRFTRITLVGQEKYEGIFRNNPRVFDFVPFKDFNAASFKEVYCGFYNETTKEISHIRVI